MVLKRAAADKVRDDAQYQLSIHTGRNFFNMGRLIDSIPWYKCSAMHCNKPRSCKITFLYAKELALKHFLDVRKNLYGKVNVVILKSLFSPYRNGF